MSKVTVPLAGAVHSYHTEARGLVEPALAGSPPSSVAARLSPLIEPV